MGGLDTSVRSSDCEEKKDIFHFKKVNEIFAAALTLFLSVRLTSSMMMDGFLELLGLGIVLSWTVDAFLFLDIRSVNVDPFLARGPPSGTV